jgi:hypothetical protein
VVRDETGSPIPGVTIAVRDEGSNRQIMEFTDVNGAVSMASLNDGIYRVDVTLDSFGTARIEHLQLKASEVTHASVALRLNTMGTIIVGAVAPDPMSLENGISTTFSQDFINKLPR